MNDNVLCLWCRGLIEVRFHDPKLCWQIAFFSRRSKAAKADEA